MKEQISAACAILSKVFSDGTYADRAFDNEDPAALTSRLVFGVLEKNVEIEYILLQLVEKTPKKFVYILLKVGIYALRYLDNVPDYAIVSECVEAAKSAGKGGAAGFVNENRQVKAAPQDLSTPCSNASQSANTAFPTHPTRNISPYITAYRNGSSTN